MLHYYPPFLCHQHNVPHFLHLVFLRFSARLKLLGHGADADVGADMGADVNAFATTARRVNK